MKTWRLLDTPAMTAAENMALDDTLLELRGKGKSYDTIRFLQFSPRSVLLGFHQSVEEEVRKGYCTENGIDINRRITGGGGIFFDENQLGWEVICDKGFFGIKAPTLKLFRTLCDPVISALDRFGLEAAFRPRNDIEINGRKISGTGGTESDDAFLFQGTMLVDFDVDTMLRSLKIPVEKLKAKEIDSVKERVTCLNWELGFTPPLAEIKDAIKNGFEQGLRIELRPGGLTDDEKELFEEKLEYYRSEEWIDLIKPEIKRQDVIQAAYKSESGMIRYTLVINRLQKKIKDLYITGDFLSFPSRAIFDLEAKLKGASLDIMKLKETISDFFDQGRIRIPGMSIDQFIKPLDLVLEKISISEFGIPLEHCNQISMTNGTFEEIISKRPSVLLLPYCSKKTDCSFRFNKGCNRCGECTVGPSWEMGSNREMKIICITSFEDLMAELLKMRKKDVKAFIGCCCQPFFAKHIDDFERAGVPGLLLHIDDTTCYELDQAKEAYAGRFESQTHVNLDLLHTVLDLHS